MKKLITSMIDTIQYNPFDLEQEKNDLPVLRPSLVLFTSTFKRAKFFSS